MVALTLPAAQLSNSFISNFEAGARRIWNEKDLDLEKQNKAIIKLTQELQDQLFPAWRATIYVFVGFVLSVFTMILPPDTLTVDYFSFDDFCAVASLLFVIIGSYWFYPTAKYAFGLKILDKYRVLIDQLNQLPTQPPDDPASAIEESDSGAKTAANNTPKPQVKSEIVEIAPTFEKKEEAPFLHQNKESVKPD